MSKPIDIDLPHHLGKDEARRRIADNIDGLQKHIPGGANVKHAWNGDVMSLSVQAMGEQVHGTIDVRESLVNVKLALPGLLGMFGGAIAGVLKNQGGLLLEDRSDKPKG